LQFSLTEVKQQFRRIHVAANAPIVNTILPGFQELTSYICIYSDR
jgi:hypothetical protein